MSWSLQVKLLASLKTLLCSVCPLSNNVRTEASKRIKWSLPCHRCSSNQDHLIPFPLKLELEKVILAFSFRLYYCNAIYSGIGKCNKYRILSLLVAGLSSVERGPWRGKPVI